MTRKQGKQTRASKQAGEDGGGVARPFNPDNDDKDQDVETMFQSHITY
jgi:hypothetical protein